MTEKKIVGTIDMTPTWEAILPMLLDAYTDGTAKSRQIAHEELFRMAKGADAYVAHQKASIAAAKTEEVPEETSE